MRSSSSTTGAQTAARNSWGYPGSRFVRSCGHIAENFGQTSGAKGGFDAARAKSSIAMDGDLHTIPPRFLLVIEKLDEGFDIVSGWRSERKGHCLPAPAEPALRNWAMAKLSGVPLHDFGTTFKAYRREIIQNSHSMGSCIVHSRSAACQGPASRRSGHKPASSTREIKVRTFQEFRVVSGSPEHKVLAGLLDQAHALLWLFRAPRDRRRLNDRSLLLFQKAIARKSITSTPL